MTDCIIICRQNELPGGFKLVTDIDSFPLKPLVPSYHLGIAPECSYSIILESNRKHLMLHESIILKLVLDLEIKYKYQPMTADWSFRVSTTKLVFAAALMRVFVTLAALRFSGTTASNCTWREMIRTYFCHTSMMSWLSITRKSIEEN